MNKLKSLIFLLSGLLIISCNDNDVPFNPDSVDFTKNFGNAASKDFLGQVVDEINNPIVGATVNIGLLTVLTDVNGVFVIKSANVYSQFARITAEKTGYIKGSRSLVPTDGINNLRIMLLSNAVTASVPAGGASEVSLPNGAKINFSGGFKDENNLPYSGSVKVTLNYVDVGDENLVAKMPGILLGATDIKLPRLLKTYGMLKVELRGNSDQKLLISTQATVKIPINPTLLPTAPSSILFWSFDEANGYWNQEGGATIQSGFYVGTVNSVSWINSATAFTEVAFRQSFVNSAGNKLANVNIGILRTGEIFPIIKTTNRDGEIASLVPSGEILTLNVYDNCGNIIKTSQIGPFTINKTEAPMTIGNELPSINIKGNLYKCDNTVVTNGYVLIKSNNQTRLSSVPNTGIINLNTLICGSGTSFTLKGGDFENSQGTEYINYTHTAPITNVGHLKTCNTVTEFISYKIDNSPVKYIVDNFQVTLSGPTIAISGNNTIGGLTMDLYGSAPTKGIYTSTQLTIDNNNDTGTIDGSPASASTISFNISQIGAVGQYVDMTFVGTYVKGSTTHTITGVAHIKRDN